MIHLAETTGIGSIEGFLTPEEIHTLTTAMTEHITTGTRLRHGTGRTDTIHEIPGHTPAQAMAVYEPAGRIEIPRLPEAAELVLQNAFDRALPQLARIMPSITACRPWTYIEYGPGQHITPHLDGIAPDPNAWPRQIAGISIVIQPARAGGEFYVETTASPHLWHHQAHDAPGYHPGMWLARDGADNSAPWFTDMPRTRWSVNPAPGTALLYGSQLTHATAPVREGTAAKFISWLIQEG
ncbi:2OG-Fe(II) oxygenase [Streptomyces sp. CS014]|uniref:2OG-Fe(II) oxygenase n=1 Tax=Streptomyces sp. CS014 TaxID=2162707 RepID=UPI000D51025C|nr:2OG-Fe(II) oxygenase [Streptomyces sp. CS014]PVD04481.1 hypothetical protein DBP12_03385 [Streptomyces sp. CS014]